MKRLINSLLKHVGWELRRISRPSSESPIQVPRASMQEGLKWLGGRQLPIQTVLDVGASTGLWTQVCLQYFPDVTYALYEPQPVHSDKLDEFVATSPQQMIPIKKAVGGRNGTTYFDATEPYGGALADHPGESMIEVELTTLDQSVKDFELKPPFLLKLDTHGFERSILAGATETLSNATALVIEAYNYPITEEAFLFWELCEFLAKRGFRTVDLVDTMHRLYDNSLWQMDLIFLRSDWDGFEYVKYQ